MLKPLPDHLLEVLQLLVEGYDRKYIATLRGQSVEGINQYIHRLKTEYFADERELQSNHFNPDRALVVIGQRYFGNIEFPMINIFDDYTHRIYQTRTRGDGHLAIEMAHTVKSWLGNGKILTSKYRQSLYSLYAKVLSEQAMAYRETVQFDDDAPLKTNKPIADELKALAKRCNDAEPLGLAYACLAHSYYIVQKYDFSIIYANRGLEFLKDIDELLILRRTLAMNWACMNERQEFQNEENKIRGLIEEGKWSHKESVCAALEGIGRGQGLLKLPQAMETLKEGEGIYNQMRVGNERVPYRGIQLIRSKLEVVRNLQPNDIQSLEEVGKNGVSLAKELGYPNCVTQIHRLLGNHLN